jgi:hypothetical protein
MLKGFQIRWGSATVASKHREALDVVNHLTRIAPAQRYNTKRHILEHLNQDATEPKHEHRAKRRILGHADDHFHPWCGHRLDDNAINPRSGCTGRHTLLHGTEGLAHRSPVLEMQLHTTHV